MTSRYRGPPRGLAQRIERLNDNLEALSEQLKDAIARAVSETVADVVRDVVRDLLGRDITTAQEIDLPAQAERPYWDEPEEDPWQQDPWQQDGWARPEVAPPAHPHRQVQPARPRWQAVLDAALQAGLWWLNQWRRSRPVLAVSLAALAAGAVLLAGPSLAPDT